jgi:mono/diheme cytochrome c family protein
MKMRSAGVLLAFALVVWLAAPGALAGGDAAKGKAVYTSKCATCHGAEGEGKPAIAKMMKVEMKHLGAKEVQSKTDAVLRKEISEGTGKMKGVKLTEEELANLLSYLRSLAKK